jgi:hypothetical protein
MQRYFPNGKRKPENHDEKTTAEGDSKHPMTKGY